eukprot:CAMPEP_0114981574 /NCGR_PEP_ID=MMETSP0216-20121206/5617_1 /TAXON_ID=223996 /ORGANISM="Protocruzia adherens, Strain Boccale" /LENGTH=415 /DNA_ID=CAMNT_0002343255 /DNA_START=64 /DNA_END=1311 /DNA_ORIENTATION=+
MGASNSTNTKTNSKKVTLKTDRGDNLPSSHGACAKSFDSLDISHRTGSTDCSTREGTHEDRDLHFDDDFLAPGISFNTKMSIDDFLLMKTISKGKYGKVLQVKYKFDHKIYALKVLKKKALIEDHLEESTRTERRLYEILDHPHIVAMKYAFQTEKKLYIVFEYHNGGELSTLLKRQGKFDEQSVKVLIAQLISAIEYLHSKGIMHRDIQLRNLLMDTKGQIKLVDFGLAKEVDGTTKTFCSSPYYSAPEMIKSSKGYGKSVDWWAVGIATYELLTGYPPFFHENPKELYETILNAPVRFPEDLSSYAKSFVSSMLHKSRRDRMKASVIKEHEFFNGIDWEKIQRGEYPLEDTREIGMRSTSRDDLSNFSPGQISGEAKDTPTFSPFLSPSSGASKTGAFSNFSYTGDENRVLSF